MRKRIAAAAMGAALLAGGGAGAALMAPVTATAADESSSTESDAQEVERGQWVADALDQLVASETITRAQADAVAEALEEARPKGRLMHRGHGPGPGLTAAATALGIEVSELRTALQDGDTIAEVAEANNVDVQKVIDAIVAEMNSHLDEAVANGRLTQAQADEMKANAAERATALVNGERPAGGPRGPGRLGGPGGPFGAPEADGSTGSTSGTSATT